MTVNEAKYMCIEAKLWAGWHWVMWQVWLDGPKVKCTRCYSGISAKLLKNHELILMLSTIFRWEWDKLPPLLYHFVLSFDGILMQACSDILSADVTDQYRWWWCWMPLLWTHLFHCSPDLICKESNPFQAKTEQYLCLLLNSKVHPGYITPGISKYKDRL
jgi:hypothetical protein